MTAFCLTLIDTFHFLDQRVSDLPHLVLAPFNLLRYNLATSNLAEHGLHPRYLHVVANWPMLFGVGIWAASDVLVQRLGGREDVKTREHGGGRQAGELVVHLLQASPSADRLPTHSLLGIPRRAHRYSLNPAAPRAPLSHPPSHPSRPPRLFRLILQAGYLERTETATSFLGAHLLPHVSRAASRVNLRSVAAEQTIWLIHSVLFTTLFGYLHQGGLVPALLKLNEGLRTPGMPFLDVQAGGSTGSESMPERIELVFWKTFMPPRHLLLPLQGERLPHLPQWLRC